MRKKLLVLLVLMCVLISIFAGCKSSSDTFVSNGSFEEIENSVSKDWKKNTYNEEGNNATIEISGQRENIPSSDQYIPAIGERSIKISIIGSSASTYLSQSVKVKRGKTYKLTAYIRVDSDLSGKYSDSNFRGAYIGFLEDPDFNAINFTKKTKGFEKVEIYFTPNSASKLTLTVGVGHEIKGLAKGSALFDGIVIEEATDVPENVTVHPVRKGGSLDNTSSSSIIFIIAGSLLSLLVAYGAYLLIRKALAKSPTLAEGDALLIEPDKNVPLYKSPLFILTIILLGAFLIRFVLSLIYKGMGTDITEMGKIAMKLQELGVFKFYEKDTTTMPMGILYYLWGVGGFANLANISVGSVGMTLLLRIPMIIADIVVCFMIYSVVSKNSSSKIAEISSALYAVLPIFFVTSTVWGMTVSISLVFIVGMLISILNKKHVAVPILFMLSLLFNNYMLLFLPIVLAYIVYEVVKTPNCRFKLLLSAVVSVIGFYLITLPFCATYVGKGNVFFVFKKITAFFAEINMFSDNTFGLYSIFGLMNVVSNNTMNILNTLFAVALGGLIAYLYYSSSNSSDAILLSGVMFIIYGIFSSNATIVYPIVGVLMLLLYAIFAREKRVLNIAFGFATIYFINIAMILSVSGYINIFGSYNSDYLMINRFNPIMIICSLLSVALSVYLVKVTYDIAYKDYDLAILPLHISVKDEIKNAFSFSKFRK